MKNNVNINNPVYLTKYVTVVDGQNDYSEIFLISSVFSQSSKNAVWIHLLPAHNSQSAFWEMFSRAFRLWDRDLDKKLSLINFPETEEQINECISYFLKAGNNIHTPKKMIVFNHFQYLKDEAIIKFVMQLIKKTTDEIIYVLLSKEPIKFSVQACFHNFSLVDRHIQFNPMDIYIYYQGNNIFVDDGALDKTMELTQGWSVMVYLLGICLPKGNTISKEQVENAVPQLFYLFNKYYFEALTIKNCEILVKLSLLENFSPDLVSDIFKMEGADLDFLFNHFPFIRNDSKDLNHHFHPLFLQFLQKKQYLYDAESNRDFLNKAAKWYQKNKNYVCAMKCYYKTEDYKGMEKMLGNMNIGIQYLQKKTNLSEQLRAVGLQIAEETLKKHPMLNLYILLFHITGRDETTGLEKLTQYKTYLTHKRKTKEELKVLGELYIYFGFRLLREGNTEFVEYFKQAYELLPGGSTIWTGKTVDYLENGCSIMEQHEDVLHWKDAFMEIAPYWPHLFGNWGRGIHFLVAAECHYFRGEMEEAALYARECLQCAVEYRQWDIAGIAIVILYAGAAWVGAVLFSAGLSKDLSYKNYLALC